MIPEIGQLALLLALAVALVQGTLPIAGAARGRADWMALAHPAAQTQCLLVVIAFGCLAASFLQNDFSVLYVASNSNSALPLAYRFAGVWGGHEGSLLLWVLMLNLWTMAVATFSAHLPRPVIARILAVMGLVSVGFLLFMLFTSNPFDRLLPAAPDGRDLNPLLQDPGMVIHPPMLYMGYVGFSVAFAFAIAALIGGNLDTTWARWTRPWTTAAWCFLTLGIALGSWWAYYELGWGGFWFWDPVENASFMPWLVGTALIHSLAVTEKRGAFKSWTVLLAIMAFSLSLLGTFLVRSGVLSSVHAFATDPRRGLFILALLVVAIGGSLVLYAWRAPKVGLGSRFELVSRESMLLANNALLVVAAGSVLLGTLYPLGLDALGLGKISVGPPYFNAVFVPLMVPIVFLMGIGPMARWKQQSLPELAIRLRWALAASVVTALVLPVVIGKWSFMVSLGLLMAAWIIITVGQSLWSRLMRNGASGFKSAALGMPRGFYGMSLAHFGIAVFIIGVTISGGYSQEKELRMAPGDKVELAGYTFRFQGVSEMQGPNYQAVRGKLEVSKGDKMLPVMAPEKRVYLVQQNPMTEAAIDAGLFRHLYIALGAPAGEGGAWSLRLYYKPFVQWIWMGPLLMLFGGLLAASDRRYRLAARRHAIIESEPAEGLAAAGIKASS
ncbi:MAG TPA: heme lyase CcmF/NrfE family subunit [Gammaproteobacteria bacterium]|nr:heme lyase CcmF/NrfE family subunit [Gammaproteobacteria bacterium]